MMAVSHDTEMLEARRVWVLVMSRDTATPEPRRACLPAGQQVAERRLPRARHAHEGGQDAGAEGAAHIVQQPQLCAAPAHCLAASP